MSRFYGYNRQQRMGMAWLAPVVQFVGGALQSHPVNGSSIQAPQHSPLPGILLAIGGIGVLGTLGYLLVKR